jgi:hypothetical protein
MTNIPLPHTIGNFDIETCHKWIHGSVQLWKEKKNDLLVMTNQYVKYKRLDL